MQIKNIIQYDNNIKANVDTWQGGGKHLFKRIGTAWLNPWYIINIRTKNALICNKSGRYEKFPEGLWGKLLESIKNKGVMSPIYAYQLCKTDDFWKVYSKRYHEPSTYIESQYKWMITYGVRFLPDGYDHNMLYFVSLDGRHRVICCRYLNIMIPAILFKKQ